MATQGMLAVGKWAGVRSGYGKAVMGGLGGEGGQGSIRV